MRPETPFPWTTKAERAVQMVADDDRPDHEIAASTGIAKATLERWKSHPEFASRVRELRTAAAADLQRYAIARKDKRMGAYNDRWQRMQQIIEERASYLPADEAPGASTGLIVKQVKIIGHGENAIRTEEYVVDTGLDAAMRATEKQAAQEAGQWAEKVEHSGDVNVSLWESLARKLHEQKPQSGDRGDSPADH